MSYGSDLLSEIATNYPMYGKNGWGISYHENRNNLTFENKTIYYWPKELELTFEQIQPIIEKFLEEKDGIN